jgi:hypothetical protein
MPCAMIPQPPSLGWPARRWTVCLTISHGASSGCGRTPARLVEQRGWCQPYRYTPATSRGVVFARKTLDRPFEVVSVLGLDEWRPGQVVAGSLPRGARELQVR